MKHVRLASCLCVITVLAAAPGAAAKPKPVPGASAFSLPSAARCLTTSRLSLKLRKVRKVTWISASVKLDGRTAKVVKRSQLTRRITLTNLPAGTFVLTATARARNGRTAKAKRSYRRCAPTPAPQPAPPAPPTPPTPPAPPAHNPAPPLLSPGSYSGSTSQGWYAAFYLSTDGRRLLDVVLAPVTLSCTPGKVFNDRIAIGEIAVDASHHFSVTKTEDGVLSGAPAHFTYTFAGQLTGTAASGTFRERVTYDDGTAFDCTSDLRTWTTTRDSQGAQTGAAASPGTYSGSTSQGWSVAFYVPADRAHLQDVAVAPATLGCTPGKVFNDQISIGEIPIATDGSFSATRTEDGVLYGVPAHFTYTFSGHLHGPNSAGTQRVAGTFRERVTYDDGSAFDCTSNTQTWTALRDNQGTQTAAAPPPGTYSGSTSQGWTVAFYVPAGGAHLQDVAVAPATLGCTPGKVFNDRLAIPDIPIASDGSFSITREEDGMIGGTAAHFTFTFSGHVHGPDSSGVARLGGTFRERITYDDGTAFDCTSNTQRWTARRDAQGAQTGAAPSPGAYSGSTSQGWTASFRVSSGGAHLETVAVSPVTLGCTPSKVFNDQLAIDDIPIASDGSFSATTTHDTVLFGVTAHVTYTFGGHFHGPSSSGVARFGGTFRERITYDDGTAHDCTSNTQLWTTTRTGP